MFILSNIQTTPQFLQLTKKIPFTAGIPKPVSNQGSDIASGHVLKSLLTFLSPLWDDSGM